MQYAVGSAPSPRNDRERLLSKVLERERIAEENRRRYEPFWNLATQFVAGNQWVTLAERTGRMIADYPDGNRKRQRHTANVITSKFWTAIGNLMGEDFKPNIWWATPDPISRRVTDHAKAALDYAWDEEIQAEDALYDMLIDLLGLGTAAIRVRLDPRQGKFLGEHPVDPDSGQPILDPDERVRFMEQAFAFGEQVQMRPLREGRLDWENISPYGLLVPPGIPQPKRFPWIGVKSPVPLSDIKAFYGEAAEGITEEDIAPVERMTEPSMNGVHAGPQEGRLRDHVMVTTMYEMPCPEYPNGLTTVHAQEKLLSSVPKLPLEVGGESKAGIAIFRYFRVPRRFWGIGLVEPMIGPQRQRNRARSQHIEYKDKNLGRVYARKGTITESNRPVGKIMELIEVKPGHDMPQEFPGHPPNAAIQAEVEMNDRDMDMAIGQAAISRGEAPRGITAYSALALMAENDAKAMGPILKGVRSGVGELTRYTCAAIKLYWPVDKQIVVGGPDPEAKSETLLYNAQTMPEAVFLRIAPGAPAPKSVAAEIQKAFDLYDRSVSSGRPWPIRWLWQAVQSGKLPDPPDEFEAIQREKAELENLMIMAGQPVQPSPHDDDVIHLEVVDQLIGTLGTMPGGEQFVALAEQHKMLHVQNAQFKQTAASSVPGLQGPQGALAQAAPGLPPEVPQ